MTKASKDAIEIHIRTYRSALRSSKEIALSTLIPTYLKMEPLLHPKANSEYEIDFDALFYALNRLSKEILKTKSVVIGQIEEIFLESGYNLKKWQRISASRRRRHIFFDPKTKTMACFAASISDIDDIVNLAIALQVEINKIVKISQIGGLSEEQKFKIEKHFKVPKQETNLKIRLLAGTWVNFSKTAQKWWQTVAKKSKPKFDMVNQPLVFLSSNNHSLINLLDHFCLDHQKEIIKTVEEKCPQVLERVKKRGQDKNPFLIYFISQFAFKTNQELWQKKLNREKRLGIKRIKPQDETSLETQIIPGKLISEKLKGLLVLNIEYPLGFTAFHLLEEILENVQNIKAVYVLGKAAALNTKIGDILIPKIIFDEHTQNTYMIQNCFNNNFPYKFSSGSVLDNQKLVSVLGTILENKDLFDTYSEKEFNIIEMEAGPYLGAITQATYPKSLPQKTVVDLHQPPFDLGMIYYSSDSPYILSERLGEFLGITGVEATYLATKAIIDRIRKIR
ncbi:hypothetical protein KKD61_02100 [Patescibacteria group bacterium]|nr:hypothetical protein [Patescibacteria group bacterium]